MSKRAVVDFFKPRVLNVVLTGLLVVAAFGGDIQRYAFTCQGGGCEGTGIEKPALYDAFRYCPCWLIWVFSVMPLIYSGLPYLMTTVDGALVSIIYFYLLASLLSFILRWMRGGNRRMQSVKP